MPTETHIYEYGDDGRAKAVTVSREPEWDEREQALMLALAEYRARCCPSGHYMPTHGGLDNEYKFTATDDRCHACTAVAIKAESMVKGNARQPSALVYRVTRR